MQHLCEKKKNAPQAPAPPTEWSRETLKALRVKWGHR